MPNNNLEKLETAIRTALPELMELSEGCEIQFDGHIITINEFNTVHKNKQVYLHCDQYVLLSDEYIVLGHPVTILHLWRWMEKVAIEATIDTKGTIWVKETTIQLDLSKPLLSQQSEEVIDELSKLIV